MASVTAPSFTEQADTLSFPLPLGQHRTYAVARMEQNEIGEIEWRQRDAGVRFAHPSLQHCF